MSISERVVSYFLEGVAYCLSFVSILIYTIRINRETQFKILTGFLFLVTVIAVKISVRKGVSNSLLYSYIYLLNSVGWSLFFFFTFKDPVRKAISLVPGLITLIYFIQKVVLSEFDRVFDSIGYVICSTGIVLLLFLYFQYLLANVKSERPSMNFNFWLSCSQLVYNLGAFAIFLTYNHFTLRILDDYTPEKRSILTSLWGVHNLLLFLSSIIILIALVWISRNRLPKNNILQNKLAEGTPMIKPN